MSGKRKPQPRIKYESYESPKIVWSKEEKRLLLRGFKKYGHTDIQSLAKLIPSKSETAIKSMIVNTMTAVRRSTRPTKTPPIDMWLEQTSPDDTNSLISQAIYFISLFERQPNPAQCNGCDLRAAYDFVYRMTQNHPPLYLQSRTRRIIYKLISKTVSKLRLKSPQNLLRYINNLYKSTSQRDYTRKPKVEQKIGLDQVVRNLNTFTVPSNQLRISCLDQS